MASLLCFVGLQLSQHCCYISIVSIYVSYLCECELVGVSKLVAVCILFCDLNVSSDLQNGCKLLFDFLSST